VTADRSSSAIQCEGLTKVLGSRRVVDSVSLSVEEGEIFGFLGRNGAGKTTTIRMLMGLMRATEGSASLLGHPVPLDRAALRDIGSLVEEPT
jgi:ABC-type multidrug transport system ATPase subunit